MNSFDASLDPRLRSSLLDEVRGNLPAFLSSASIERRGPVRASASLLQLSATDINRVLAIHMLMADEVRALSEALQLGMRRPSMASTRPKVVGRSVTSGIDWAATMRARATSSPTGELWVTRPANRIFDTPENRALAWALRAIRDLASTSAPRDSEAPWARNARRVAETAGRALQTSWLASVASDWPGDYVYERLGADRTSFYRFRVAAATKYLRRLLINPPAQEVVEAICNHYFEPTNDWQLFEIAVLLRIARAFDLIGERVGAIGMFAGHSGPFVTFAIADDIRISLWYQRWPKRAGSSEVSDAIRYYGINAGGTRPDIVGEVTVGATTHSLILLELKASTSSSYLASGLVQLLGYLRDRPDFTRAEASGWLVAPPSPAFTSKEPKGRALWVIDSDQVAERLVTRVRELLPDKVVPVTDPTLSAPGQS